MHKHKNNKKNATFFYRIKAQIYIAHLRTNVRFCRQFVCHTEQKEGFATKKENMARGFGVLWAMPIIVEVSPESHF